METEASPPTVGVAPTLAISEKPLKNPASLTAPPGLGLSVSLLVESFLPRDALTPPPFILAFTVFDAVGCPWSWTDLPIQLVIVKWSGRRWPLTQEFMRGPFAVIFIVLSCIKKSTFNLSRPSSLLVPWGGRRKRRRSGLSLWIAEDDERSQIHLEVLE